MHSTFGEKENFLLNHSQIPRGNSNVSSLGSQHMDLVKAVLTLRSGKVVEKPIVNPCEQDNELFPKSKEGVEPTTTEEKTKPSHAPPFPYALTHARKVNYNLEIFEIFK